MELANAVEGSAEQTAKEKHLDHSTSENKKQKFKLNFVKTD